MAILKIRDNNGNIIKYRASISGIGSIKINGRRVDTIEEAREDEARLYSEREEYYKRVGHRKKCRNSKYVRVDTIEEVVSNAETMIEIIGDNCDIYTAKFAIQEFLKTTKNIVDRIKKEKGLC